MGGRKLPIPRLPITREGSVNTNVALTIIEGSTTDSTVGLADAGLVLSIGPETGDG